MNVTTKCLLYAGVSREAKQVSWTDQDDIIFLSSLIDTVWVANWPHLTVAAIYYRKQYILTQNMLA